MTNQSADTTEKPKKPARAPKAKRDATSAEVLKDTEIQGENSAGKPADTPNAPAEGHTAAPGGEEPTLPATHTEGADDAGKTAEALLHAPGGAQEPAPVLGGEATILPADQSEGADAEVPEAMISVVCHAEAGRRRAGRRWPAGETRVPASELTEGDIAVLRGDPRFTVTL